MKYLFSLLAAVLGCLFVSCSMSSSEEPDQSFAPVLDPSSGQPVALKPRDFALNEETRPSQVMALGENITEPLTPDWSNRLVGVNPAAGQQTLVAVMLADGQAWEKSKPHPGRYLFPIIALASQNVPKPQIDTAMPKIQREVYRRCRQYCRTIPNSALRDIQAKKIEPPSQ